MIVSQKLGQNINIVRLLKTNRILAGSFSNVMKKRFSFFYDLGETIYNLYLQFLKRQIGAIVSKSKKKTNNWEAQKTILGFWQLWFPLPPPHPGVLLINKAFFPLFFLHNLKKKKVSKVYTNSIKI